MANAYSGVATAGDVTALNGAVLPVYSMDIEHAALPVMRFNEFFVEKEDLTKQAGETITFTEYADIALGGALTEGTAMETKTMSASNDTVTVTEYGNAVGVSEKLLQLSFDDQMRRAAILLGRDYAKVSDITARNALAGLSNTLFAGNAASRAAMTGTDYFDVELIRQAVELLQTNNAPKFYADGGEEFYVCFLHPHQAARLKRDPDWVAAQHYAQTRNLFNGELGRWEDVIFIGTTMCQNGAAAATAPGYDAALVNAANSSSSHVYRSFLFGDNCGAHAGALPVEMRDGGVVDFGRKHELAWYSIEGWGIINDDHGVILESV